MTRISRTSSKPCSPTGKDPVDDLVLHGREAYVGSVNMDGNRAEESLSVVRHKREEEVDTEPAVRFYAGQHHDPLNNVKRMIDEDAPTPSIHGVYHLCGPLWTRSKPNIDPMCRALLAVDEYTHRLVTDDHLSDATSLKAEGGFCQKTLDHLALSPSPSALPGE